MIDIVLEVEDRFGVSLDAPAVRAVPGLRGTRGVEGELSPDRCSRPTQAGYRRAACRPAIMLAVPTKCYVFPPKDTPEGEFEVYELSPNVNTADPKCIGEFFEWANKRAPAKNIFLILWGHGYWVDDYTPFANREVAPGPEGRFIEESFTAGIPDSNVPFPVVHAPVRDLTERALPGGPPDDDRRAFLKNNQIGDAVKKCRECLEKEGKEQKLALLGFDCCDMSLLEVWFEMEGAAEIGIGSQYGLPYKGWPYASMLRELKLHPDLTPPQLAKLVVEEFASYHEKNPMIYSTSRSILTLSS